MNARTTTKRLADLNRKLTEAAAAEARAWDAAAELSDAEATDDHPLIVAANAACKRTAAIVRKIEQMQAQTLPEVLVKVRAAIWCRVPDMLQIDRLGVCRATDQSVLASLFADLMRLAEPVPMEGAPI